MGQLEMEALRNDTSHKKALARIAGLACSQSNQRTITNRNPT